MDSVRSEQGTSDLRFPRARWRAARPFVLMAGAAIVLGGLVAAATGPLELQHGSWAAAYLVLVVGVGQLVLGLGQAALGRRPPSPLLRAWQACLYNLGNVAVLVGTFLESTVSVLTGGALLLVALVLFLGSTRGAPVGAWTVLYRLMAAVLAISVPVGLVLSVSGR